MTTVSDGKPNLRVVREDEPLPREPILPNAVLGMLIFVLAEAMLFAGFISAHVILKANAVGGIWPPPGQPRLPVEMTAFNTLLLLVSGVMIWQAGKAFDAAEDPRPAFLRGVVLGSTFVLLQGYEWASLIGEGLTLTSSSYGAFFYLIVGVHALHAIAAILALVAMYRRLGRGVLSSESFQATRLFWYFVVGVWPVLYTQVYL